MIYETRRHYKHWADALYQIDGIKYDAGASGSQEEKDVTRALIDGYCAAKDNNDELRQSAYISGLMLRFWYTIKQLKSKCNLPNHTEEDYHDWLHEAIELACHYRAWQQPEKKVNAQQAIRMCIETIRKRKLYKLSSQKRSGSVTIESLDRPLEFDGTVSLIDTINDKEQELKVSMSDGTSRAIEMIQSCINQNRIEEAIILDTIAFNDTEKVEKTIVKKVLDDGSEMKQTITKAEFWDFKCLNILQNLPVDYFEYFCSKYDISEPSLEAALNALRSSSRAKLRKKLENTKMFGRTLYSC